MSTPAQGPLLDEFAGLDGHAPDADWLDQLYAKRAERNGETIKGTRWTFENGKLYGRLSDESAAAVDKLEASSDGGLQSPGDARA